MWHTSGTNALATIGSNVCDMCVCEKGLQPKKACLRTSELETKRNGQFY